MRLNLYSISFQDRSGIRRKLRRLSATLFIAGVFTQPLSLAAQSRPQMHRPDPSQDVKKTPKDSKPRERAPRAIAVVEWRPDSQGRAVAKLLPVAILDDGKFHDATLYRAAPRPMALDTGVVYEAQMHGEPIGFFTVESAEQQKEHWAAVGAWKSTTPRLDTGRPPTQSAQVRGTGPTLTKPSDSQGDSQDDRDTQKNRTVTYDEHGREIPPDQANADDNKAKNGKNPEPLDRRPRVAKPGEGIPPSERTNTSSGSNSSGNSDPDRPKLKKNPSGAEQTKADTPDVPPASKQPAAGAGDQRGGGQASDADSDRPRLHRGGSDSSSSSSTPNPDYGRARPSSTRDDNDADRPVLKRGGQSRSGSQNADQQNAAGAPIPIRAKESGGRRLGDTENKAYEVVAVSDAEQAADSHTFAFRISPDERDQDMQKIMAIARKEVEAFRAEHYGATTRSPALRPGARPRSASRNRSAEFRWAFTDQKMSVFDLFSNNNPELVYTARVEPDALAPKSPETFVTVVASVDPDGTLEKVFSSVTDAERLDATPHLELVDAVDSSGKGRGDLLFRRDSASDSDFVLYRVAGSQLQELFHGGWAGE